MFLALLVLLLLVVLDREDFIPLGDECDSVDQEYKMLSVDKHVA